MQTKKLPDHWHIDQNPLCRSEAVVQGTSWRVTVLTASLLRLEYSPDGLFEDRATQFALNRNFPPCKFSAEDNGEELTIATETMLLRYDKKPLSKIGLSVRLLGNAGIFNRFWCYGNQGENLGGTVRTLDRIDGAVPLEPGILSKSGIAVVDDSRTPVLDSSGWVEPRREDENDLYIFAYGRNYRDCLKDFYRLTGPTPLLPRYALGNWWSRFYRYTEQSYKD